MAHLLSTHGYEVEMCVKTSNIQIVWEKTSFYARTLKNYFPSNLLFKTFRICFAKWIYSLLKIH